MKGATEAGVPTYVGAVVGGEAGEGGAELVQLAVEVFDLGGGELVGEHVEGFEGVLLPLKSGHARTAESMHTVLVGKSTYLFSHPDLTSRPSASQKRPHITYDVRSHASRNKLTRLRSEADGR